MGMLFRWAIQEGVLTGKPLKIYGGEQSEASEGAERSPYMYNENK